MREIKFRVWNSDEKRIMPWKLVRCYGLHNFETADFPIMQYIGLKDKNGKEIYEGDVVTCKLSHNGGFLPHMGAITWNDWYGAFATKNDAGLTLLHNHAPNTFEVIGNIYENPELLKP